MRSVFLSLSAFSLLVAHSSRITAAAEPPIDFNRDIRPILSNVCFDCHGPDKNQRKADLRLDQKEDVFRERGGYSLVSPGKPDDSELLSRITDTDPRQRMPPPDALRQLTPPQIDLIQTWIKQGARWQEHWAYVPPTHVPPPEVAGDTPFVRNDIDRFILQGLKAQNLKPSPEADRATLIRRLTFDLLGLPPSPDEVSAFVNDASDDAYEKVVDRLLASPHFGERMAMFWLDLVRYADTNGYHGDNHEDRDMYRDWVIEAFNRNLPFDRFTVEQLAGDLLPDATTESRIASGYNRLLMTTREGGAQAKEYLAKYSADRVRNFSAVWLAGTMGCCECHDHKYDPFTTRDFYSMAAWFADIQEIPVGEQPGTKIPTPEESEQLAALDRQLAPLNEVLARQTPELDAAQTAWEQSLRERRVEWTVIKSSGLNSPGGATFKVLDDGSILAGGPSPDQDTYTFTFQTKLQKITALRLEVLPDDSLPSKGPGRASNGNFVLHELEARFEGVPLDWGTISAEHSQPNYDVAGAGDGKPDTGWAILDHTGRATTAVFELKLDQASDAEGTLTLSLAQNYGSGHTLGRMRFSVTTAPRPVRATGNGLPGNIAELLAIAPEQRSAEQRAALAAFYRTIAPQLEVPRRQATALQKERDALFGGVRTTLVSMSGQPRMIRVLPRGNWLDDSGEVVMPGVPGFLSTNQGPSGNEPLTRLDLARWLVSPDHPLTARVFVNRLWKLAFGQGIVRTVEDFGSQGTPPTHPELLDWLALEFSRPRPDATGATPKAWDVKRILKQIVMSATYRQSSHADESLRHLDPYNLWLARQGRFRLDAEVVRDNVLAVSGLLVNQLGGPSAHPYQPPGYWAYLNFPVREWQADRGDGLYRRGLYTYWCRTFLHPSLKAFDAPTREECVADRPRSNTPLQALVLLNDPSYVEAARGLAGRILREGGITTESRLQFAFMTTLSRPGRAEEIAILKGLYERHLAQFHSDAAGVDALLKVGDRPIPPDANHSELAAWMSVSRALFNLHEFVTRN